MRAENWKMRIAVACLLVIAAGCQSTPKAAKNGGQAGAGARSDAAADGARRGQGAIPDLLKGEGPDPKVLFEKRPRPDWYLHFYDTRGWIYGEKTAEANRARQLLITHVPSDSAVSGQLKAGDVLLGVNGKPFDKHPVYQFREFSAPANRNDAGLSVILWRKGWSAPRTVDLEPRSPQPDFTKGDTIELTQTGTPVDRNLGATGARGWIYGKDKTTQQARQILITKVYKGSPADGILQKGDVILGIGQKRFSSDARKALGRAITQAESREGRGQLGLLRWRSGATETVTLRLAVMGSYSATTPWNCEKSQKILDNACAYLIRSGTPQQGEMSIPAKIRTLALMATGNDQYMPVIREHIATIVDKTAVSGERPPEKGLVAWSWGYTNLLLCEYFLLTRDETVLPAIRKYSTAMALGQACSGTWGHGMALPDKFTGKPHGALGGYGSMNQASTICWMSLVLAKRCGVTHPEIEQAITRAHEFLAYFIDMGSVTYGDNLTAPDKHDDNGKTSAAAVAFAAFADAKATRFCSQMTVASHDVREEGHTGNFFSMLWGPLGAARAGQPACSAFLHENTWFYDLERRWDGGFEYQGKAGMGNGIDPRTGRQRTMSEHQYAHWDTTGSRILMYCLPRKKLAITGRDVTTTELTPDEVADSIEAARYPTGLLDRTKKYDDCTVEQLMELLGSWSPVVRERAASSLARKEGDHAPALKRMLRSRDRYARYGACGALKALGPKARPALAELIACLESEDRVLQLNALRALGTSDDMRAATALLRMASRDFPNDRYDIVHRYIAEALFGSRDSLVERTRTVADRALLLKATRRFLNSVTGHCRTVIGQNVADTLTLQEVRMLWSALDSACNRTATTYNTAIQTATLRLMAKYHIKEGIDRCVWYLTHMRGHGSENRVPEVLESLLQYGPHARYAVPQLEKIAAHFDSGPEGFPVNLSKQKARHVREAIRVLEAVDEKQKAKFQLVSIRDE